MLELSGMQSTPLLPGQPLPGVIVPDMVLCMGQIEQNYVIMLNCIVLNWPVFDIEPLKLC